MDDLATRCRTVATRLSKPHSEHIKDAAFDHLHEAATALATSAARIEAKDAALQDLLEIAEMQGIDGDAEIAAARAALDAAPPPRSGAADVRSSTDL